MKNAQYHLRTQISPEDKYDTLCKRIDAKSRFWDFLNSIKAEIPAFESHESDLCEQVITVAMSILYGHFDAFELTEEVRSFYRTSALPLPVSFHRIFSETFTEYITKQLAP